jgi:hypothetical protein
VSPQRYQGVNRPEMPAKGGGSPHVLRPFACRASGATAGAIKTFEAKAVHPTAADPARTAQHERGGDERGLAADTHPTDRPSLVDRAAGDQSRTALDLSTVEVSFQPRTDRGTNIIARGRRAY